MGIDKDQLIPLHHSLVDLGNMLMAEGLQGLDHKILVKSGQNRKMKSTFDYI